MKEIVWINSVRSICMICVFILHTESRFGIDSFAYSYFFEPFFLTVFFFVSGYLMLYHDTINYRNKLKSIIGKMLWPYFVFTSIIWLPKVIYHQGGVNSNYLIDVFGGTASWFIAALIVAELTILVIVRVFRKTFHPYYLLIGLLLFVLAQYLMQWDPSPFPWYYQAGFANVLFLFLGAAYKRVEKYVSPFMNKWSLLILAIAYLTIMLVDLKYIGYYSQLGTIQWAILLLNFVESIIGISLMLNFCFLLPKISFLSYIGRNSIVFYFLSGAIPTVVGVIFNKLHFPHTYSMMLFVTLVSLLIVFPITFVLKKHFPIVIDLFYKK